MINHHIMRFHVSVHNPHAMTIIQTLQIRIIKLNVPNSKRVYNVYLQELVHVIPYIVICQGLVQLLKIQGFFFEIRSKQRNLYIIKKNKPWNQCCWHIPEWERAFAKSDLWPRRSARLCWCLCADSPWCESRAWFSSFSLATNVFVLLLK